MQIKIKLKWQSTTPVKDMATKWANQSAIRHKHHPLSTSPKENTTDEMIPFFRTISNHHWHNFEFHHDVNPGNLTHNLPSQQANKKKKCKDCAHSTEWNRINTNFWATREILLFQYISWLAVAHFFSIPNKREHLVHTKNKSHTICSFSCCCGRGQGLHWTWRRKRERSWNQGPHCRGQKEYLLLVVLYSPPLHIVCEQQPLHPQWSPPMSQNPGPWRVYFWPLSTADPCPRLSGEWRPLLCTTTSTHIQTYTSVGGMEGGC